LHAEWNEFGSGVGCSYMASSMTKDIYRNWNGIRNECWGVGTKVGLRMMITMLDASEKYG
jgi:hypothetical protein